MTGWGEIWRAMLAAAFIVALAALVVACSQTSGGPREPNGLVEKDVPLRDGRTVVCVYVNESGEGPALSCDWPGASR